MKTGWRNTILTGDAQQILREVPTESVDCVITSPPYFLLRNYGVAGQIGLEPNVEAWVTRVRAVVAELCRVLVPTGALWLNLGDSYSRHERYGAPPKSALLGPERLLLALAADGWIVRNKVVWQKANGLPASVGDRLASVYDAVYLLVRSRHYYFDLDAIRVPHAASTARHRPRLARREVPPWAGPHFGTQAGLRRGRRPGEPGHPLGRNPGDVWKLPTASFHGGHFATFPEALVERPLLATCPEVVCTRCHKPWMRRRVVAGVVLPASHEPNRVVISRMGRGPLVPCGCDAPTRRGLVLDPFFGSGTVGVVAQRLRRDWLGIELNPKFVAMASARLAEAA